MVWAFSTASGAGQPLTPPAPAASAETAAIPSEVLSPASDLETLEVMMIGLTERELAQVAEAWRNRFRTHVLRQSRLLLELENADAELRGELRARFGELREQRIALSERYRAVMTAWEDKGAPAEEIARFRRYHRAVLTEGARHTDQRSVFSGMLRWLVDPTGALADAVRLAVLAASVAGAVLAARMMQALARRRLRRWTGLSTIRADALSSTLYWVALLGGFLVILHQYGVNLNPVLALLGGATFILAFAMQDSLGNIVSGVMIMLNRPFDAGDHVTIDGVEGQVASVGMSATTITTPDNREVVIPNGKVWGGVIVNASANTTRRVDLVFDVHYGSDLTKVATILRDAAQAHPLTLADPAPAIEIAELSENAVKVLCRPWTRTHDYWRVRWDLLAAVKARFDAEGVVIPFPQLDVRLAQNARPVVDMRPPGGDGMAGSDDGRL